MSALIDTTEMSSTITWDNLTSDDTKERLAEHFLWQVDIGIELSNPNYNSDAAKYVIKNSIFECMSKYKSNGVQARAFQLLQDIYLFTKGDITNDDIKNNFDHILDALKNAISYPDIASSSLELLSMLATKTFTKRKFYDSDIFQSSIINVITSHSSNKGVIRAGMTFFVEICKTSINNNNNNNDNDITISFSFSVAEKILLCMQQSILLYPDDMSLFLSFFRFVEEFLDNAPRTPNNTSTISKNHTNIIIDIIIIAISNVDPNNEILQLSFACIKNLRLEKEHIEKINNNPRGIMIYLDFLNSNPSISIDVLNHLELIVQGLKYLDIYNAHMSTDNITIFRDNFIDKVKELEGDNETVEKIYNYYIEITDILNKILPQTDNEKQSTDILTAKLDNAKGSPNNKDNNNNLNHNNNKSLSQQDISILIIDNEKMSKKINEQSLVITNLFKEMDGLRKSNIEMYNKMFSSLSELIDTKKLLESKQYDYDEGKRMIKDMINLTTLSQKQAVMAIEEADNFKTLYNNTKEENELLRDLLDTNANTFPNLDNNEIIRFPTSPEDKATTSIERNDINDNNDNDNDNEKSDKAMPVEGMVSLTIVGITEALRDYDTLLKKNHHHHHKDNNNNTNVNLLRSDKGLSLPVIYDTTTPTTPTPTSTTTTTTTLATSIETLARITRLVYKSFKKGSYCGNEKVNHTTMSMQTLRLSLKELGLVTTNNNTTITTTNTTTTPTTTTTAKKCTLIDVDMIVVRLGIFQKVSIFGFIYIVLMLALKNDSHNNHHHNDINKELVIQQVTNTLENYLNKQKTNNDDDDMTISLSQDEATRVNKMFDDERLSLKNLFLSYLPNVPRRNNDDNKNYVSTTSEGGFGLSLEIILQFCRDFSLTPAIIHTSTVIQIFEHILSTGFVSGHGEPLLNYYQYRSFLLHICVKCNYFEDYHGRDKIERRLYNLFYYLDHSSGFDCISHKDRNITITRFKLIYAKEDAKINKELQITEKKKADFMRDNIALKRVTKYKPM